MADHADPKNHAHFRVRDSLRFAADLIKDEFPEFKDDKLPDAILAIAQTIAIESVADSLADVEKQLQALSDKLATVRTK